MIKNFLQRSNKRIRQVGLRSLMVCLCLALSGLSAWGQNNFGDFDVSGETTNAAYENDVLTITGSGVIVKNLDFGTATNDRIVIDGGTKDSPIEVTLAGVNIKIPEKVDMSTIEIEKGSNVKLIIENKNNLETPYLGISDDYSPALCVKANVTLEIIGKDEAAELNAISDNIAIGGKDNDNSVITISGGKICAKARGTSVNIAAIGGFGNGNVINIKGGTIDASATTKGPQGWCIGGTNGSINIFGGIITTSDSGSSGIGGNNSQVTITGGSIDINTRTGGGIGIGSYDKSSIIMISGGFITIDNSLTLTGAHGTSIQGKSLTTDSKGNAIIVAKSSNIKNEDVILESEDKGKWNMILLEYPKSNSNKEIDVEGYVYGNVSLEQDFTIEEDYSLIIDPKSELTLNSYTVINNGRIYFAYEKQGLKNSISTGNGNKCFQIFYDLDGIPEELKDGILTNQYIESDGKIEKKEMYSTEDPFLFAKKGDQVTLKWKEDGNLSMTIQDGKSTINVPEHNGWLLTDFKVKTTKNGDDIPVNNLTFTMPDEAVTIYDIELEKKSYNIITGSVTEGLEVHFEDKEGNVITKSLPGEDVFVIVSAPGYSSFDISSIEYGSSAWYSFSKQIISKDDGKYKFTMPKYEVKVGVQGNVSGDKISYKLCVDKPENGEIIVDYEVGVDEDNLHYKDLIKVSTKPEEGYKLTSLVYSYQENGETKTVPIENGSFTMPAADVTISATFEPIQYQVTIADDIQHGKVVANPQIAAAGSEINLTVTPEIGYQINELYYKVESSEDAVPISNNSFKMPAANVTVYATFEAIKYQVSIADDIENGTVTASPTEATLGETITLTVTPDNGYQLDKLYYIATETTTEVSITGSSFTMPAANVTVYASFAEKDEPSEPVNPPVDPINYYNIYDETTYDFIDVSFSRNVVREGGSVNVHLEIPEGLDPAAVTLMYKRGMYGTWGALNLNDDNQYQINNIWTDIYVKAVVDESFIDPNPDENHIYIDLSETNDSIWLYTDHQLVEEGKTAVIQAEVAKSCRNKEIRYMYKRTVLGEWKEMPKDYSINQYVVRDITTDIYVKAYFVFDKQDPVTAKNPHHVYADITATSEGLYLDATRHKVADEGDTKVFLYVKKGFETKDARYLFKRGLKGEWEDLVPGIEQNTFEVTNIEEDIYLKGIDAIYTGTEGVDGVIRVYTKDGSLYVYTAQPEEISVISMTGVTVKRTQQTGLQSYPLNQGIYVVLVGEQVFKVRVK